MSKVVLFDAVGTVIKPDPSVISVYQQLGKDFGSRLSTSELKTRIAEARQQYFHVGLAADLASDDLLSSDEIELNLWKQLVVDVFREIPDSNRLFEELWEHFRLPQHWRLYDEVASCWDRLRAQGCLIGLASNFDSRLLQLCDSIPLLKTADFVFQSAGVGFRKPSPGFYRRVEKELRESSVISNLSAFKIYMVGDDLENDCLGPNRAGWSGFWLNRSENSCGNHEVQQVCSLSDFASRILG